MQSQWNSFKSSLLSTYLTTIFERYEYCSSPLQRQWGKFCYFTHVILKKVKGKHQPCKIMHFRKERPLGWILYSMWVCVGGGVCSFFLDPPPSVSATQNITLLESEHDYVLMCSSVTSLGFSLLIWKSTQCFFLDSFGSTITCFTNLVSKVPCWKFYDLRQFISHLFSFQFYC